MVHGGVCALAAGRATSVTAIVSTRNKAIVVAIVLFVAVFIVIFFFSFFFGRLNFK